MSNEIIVDVSMGQTRVALLEEKELVELYIESKEYQSIAGNIYYGTVVSVLPGMQAAFVNIGTEKNAFLYVKDIISKSYFTLNTGSGPHEPGCSDTEPSVANLIKKGEQVIVQVIKEPIDTKGPRVTMNITLPGRYLVLLPNDDYIGISKKIEDEEEKRRLKQIAEVVKPEGRGMIVRTEAEGRGIEDLKNDLDFLIKLWDKVQRNKNDASAPQLLHKDYNLIFRTVRDLFNWNIDKFIINNREQYATTLEFVDMISPSLSQRIKYFSKNYDIFEYYQIEGKISKALEKKVWLKCGGYLIIDRTEALTVIDVNTGKYVGETNLENTVLITNLEAAKEIAKQLRLRDIGGIIIIDFIDMHGQEHREKVLEMLKYYLKKDRTKSTVVGITSLGLVEMTRKKVRERLSDQLKIECPYCNGKGKILSPKVIARLAELDIYKLCNQTNSSAIEVQLHPSVVQHLEGCNNSNIRRLETIFNKRIYVTCRDDLNRQAVIVKEVDNYSTIC